MINNVATVSATQSDQTPTLRASRRIVLCLDGTWSSAFDEHERRDGHKVLKPTNVLKISRATLPKDDRTGQAQIAYYDIGVGSLAEYAGAANAILHFSDRVLGGAWGAGFEGNVEDALHFLILNYEEGDELFVFGFSRGAATARAVTRFLEWNHGLPEKADAYYLPRLFRAYVVSHGGEGEQQALVNQINSDRKNVERPAKPPLKPFRPVPVKYLGVWDTVMALGSRFEATGKSTSSPGRSFYAGTAPASCVKRARQALAIDESRSDFRPEIWTHSLPNQVLEQRCFAGVHSNIGGGYVNDGLANIAFHWILEAAIEEGLRIDPEYVQFYKPYEKDALYDSGSLMYRVLEFLRLRRGRGNRQLIGLPAAANLDLDPSVIKRIQANPNSLSKTSGENGTMKPYRPENVLLFLACQPDLDTYLKKIHAPPADALPDDVRGRVQELKHRCPPASLQSSAVSEP